MEKKNTTLFARNATKAGKKLEPDKRKRLTKLKQICFSCQVCEIGQATIDGYRPQVFARGNVNAPIMLVGQNPGKTEIQKSKPFVGDAGDFLDNTMIKTLGLRPKDIYVTNAVKCYTPNNRVPSDTEIATCHRFLKKEIEIVKPKLIVTLGNPALKTMTGKVGITTLNGVKIRSAAFDIDVFPLLHPASTLHNKPKYLPMMEEGLQKLKSILHEYVEDLGMPDCQE